MPPRPVLNYVKLKLKVYAFCLFIRKSLLLPCIEDILGLQRLSIADLHWVLLRSDKDLGCAVDASFHEDIIARPKRDTPCCRTSCSAPRAPASQEDAQRITHVPLIALMILHTSKETISQCHKEGRNLVP